MLTHSPRMMHGIVGYGRARIANSMLSSFIQNWLEMRAWSDADWMAVNWMAVDLMAVDWMAAEGERVWNESTGRVLWILFALADGVAPSQRLWILIFVGVCSCSMM